MKHLSSKKGIEEHDSNNTSLVMWKSLGILVLTLSLTTCGKDAVDPGPAGQSFLINGATQSPILEAATPRAGAQCSLRELKFTNTETRVVTAEICDDGTCAPIDVANIRLLDRTGRVNPDNIRFGVGNASGGGVEPVEGPDGLLWLCREDEDAQECICIPWAQD